MICSLHVPILIFRLAKFLCHVPVTHQFRPKRIPRRRVCRAALRPEVRECTFPNGSFPHEIASVTFQRYLLSRRSCPFLACPAHLALIALSQLHVLLASCPCGFSPSNPV